MTLFQRLQNLSENSLFLISDLKNRLCVSLSCPETSGEAGDLSLFAYKNVNLFTELPGQPNSLFIDGKRCGLHALAMPGAAAAQGVSGVNHTGPDVVHKRDLSLQPDTGGLRILDKVVSATPHAYSLQFLLAAGIRPRCRADGVYLLRDHLCLGELRFESEQRHKVSVRRISLSEQDKPIVLTDFYDVDYFAPEQQPPNPFADTEETDPETLFLVSLDFSPTDTVLATTELALYDQPVPAEEVAAEALFTPSAALHENELQASVWTADDPAAFRYCYCLYRYDTLAQKTVYLRENEYRFPDMEEGSYRLRVHLCDENGLTTSRTAAQYPLVGVQTNGPLSWLLHSPRHAAPMLLVALLDWKQDRASHEYLSALAREVSCHTLFVHTGCMESENWQQALAGLIAETCESLGLHVENTLLSAIGSAACRAALFAIQNGYRACILQATSQTEGHAARKRLQEALASSGRSPLRFFILYQSSADPEDNSRINALPELLRESGVELDARLQAPGSALRMRLAFASYTGEIAAGFAPSK